MSEQTVLYDAPGPRARMITIVSSVIAAVLVIAGAYFFVYLPMDEKGQFDEALWGPLLDPSNAVFDQVWERLGEGFLATLEAAVLAIVCSLVVGTLLAIWRVQLKALSRRRFPGVAGVRFLVVALNVITRFFVEVFRGIPVVVTIVFCWALLPKLGIDLGGDLGALVLGLTIYNSVVIGEILRSGMEGLPGGQREAADAIGLTTGQSIRLILLPQAYRIMLPALISQLVVVLKDTSLGFIITYEEALRISNTTIIPALHNPIQTFVVVGAIFILANYLLSKLASYTQRRLARGRKAPGGRAAPPAALSGEMPGAVAVQPAPVGGPPKTDD
ncbi:glutamate ABC transporter permease [Virgisporangium aliadipatigenens]|uniref:Glutamate ABC transporter permease n=1 Tax=Virgisporangium aliadipatigenens TaxID=741659 RepID=A0A8J3YIV9_9ACTN|nr:amino acid ABC transporter permease [Virgisporangium aliadipatigenens]GIJ45931.1 glutamate ABC transporter permease [Virgisporangium aliadipatigenens]